MAANNMHNLTTLIKRLEAATSRLEDMATTTTDASKSIGAPAGLAAPTAALPTPPMPPSPPAPKEVLPESILDFEALINSTIVPFTKLSEELGGGLAQQAAKVLQAFEAQREFLLIQTKSKKPQQTDAAYMELLKDTQEGIMGVNDIKDKNRGKPDFNQLSAVAEGISMLAWVTVDMKPWKHVDESLGSAQFYGNRVLKLVKEKQEKSENDNKQVEWVQSLYKIFVTLSQYVQDTFPIGLPWNPKGLDPLEAQKVVKAAKSSAPAPSGGAPPPPPPPPPGPPPMFDITSASGPPPPPVPASGSVAPAGGLGAVFSELNKGEAVTKGLRKVTADQMTHKNPSLRAGSTVPERTESAASADRARSPVPGKKPKPESMRTKRPPRQELVGDQKWYIENYEDESRPITIEVDAKQSVLISKCDKTTIILRGKANAISIDNCNRLSIVVESLVSSVDVIRAQNLELQVTGVLPTILMDQVDGASVYLSPQSAGTEVYSSKCSSINLNLPKGDEGDYKENAVPEQIRTYIGKDGKIVSEIVEHAG